MRKYLLLLMASVLSLLTAQAQPTAFYDVKASTGSYDEISGGTVVGSALSANAFNSVVFDKTNTANTNQVTAEGYPIGFNFKFNNIQMNQFMVASNGYILLGNDKITAYYPKNSYNALSSGADINVIGAVSNGQVYGLSNTEISYKVIGNAPNRSLVIQYKNLGLTDRWGENVVDTAQLQLRLYETSGKIEILFKHWATTETSSMKLRIGIKGSMTDDRLLLNSSAQSYSDVLGTTSNSASISWISSCYPADGQTYTFTPPADCETPTTQPTTLKLSSGSNYLAGSFSKADAADHYLVLLNQSKDLSTLPTNDTYYKKGDLIGDATVVAYDTLTSFKTNENLDGAKAYYIHVIATNSYCMFGPKYNTTTPLTATYQTMPVKPESITITQTDLNSLSFNVKANSKGNKVLVAETTIPTMNQYGNIFRDGSFGQPTGTYNVNDSIIGGGKVIYMGEAKDGISISDLKENTVYHLMAWSIDENGNYSTTSVTDNMITAGKVPYLPDFSLMPSYEVPIGWNVIGSDYRTDKNVLECRISKKDPTNGVVNAIETPWVYLTENTNRVLFDMNMTQYVMWSNSAYNDWADQDSILVQVTDDDINYTTVYTMTKANAPHLDTADSYANIYAPFDQFAGKKVKIRLYWRTYNGPTLKIINFKIEEKKACDYPINVTTVENTVVGDQAQITWKSQGEEDTWELRYKQSNDSVWTEPIEERMNPCTIKGLPSTTDMDVQVRAKCSATSQSDWSKTYSFRSGYSIPFTERFDESTLPNGWDFKTGAISDSTDFCSGGDCVIQWEWSNSYFSKGVILSPRGKTADEWLITPSFDLGDGSANYNFNFAVMNTGTGSSTDEACNVVISTDNGKTFSDKNIIKTIKKSEFPEEYNEKIYSVSLKGYKGLVRIGIYTKATDGSATGMQMDSIFVTPTCPSDIVPTVSDVTTTSAKVTWESGADKWFVFTRKAGETTKAYKEQTTKEIALTDLTPRTAYEVGITKMCEVGDTAKVVLAKFTTQALAPCQQVTDVKVTPTKYSAVFNWTGEASAYNFKYRAKGSEAWTLKQATDTTITVTGLEEAKTYEYIIQSVCSTLSGDTSAYTPVAEFSTLAETCFPPTNIAATPTYKSATLTWEGEADNYEINYCKKEESAWTSVKATGNTATIEGLDAETAYKVRMRSFCSVTDTSKWSTNVEFTTLAIPECVTPTDLTVSQIKSNSALLSWTADASNLTWDLHYRASTVSAWTTQNSLTDKEYQLNDLKENTAYIWSVKATCEEGRTSNWASQNKFTTIETGIANNNLNELTIFVSHNVLNIVNPERGLLKEVQLFTTAGQLIGNYKLNSDENVFITLGKVPAELIVKVIGEKQTKSSKVFIK